MKKNKWKEVIVNHKKAAVVTIIIVVLSAIMITAISAYKKSAAKEIVYKETSVVHGDLKVGVTEDSAVSIGTIEQNFDLDISALVSSDSTSSSTSDANQPMGGMFQFGQNNYNTRQQEMEIESVAVTVGTEISAGDELYTLKQEDVDEIRTQLEKDVENTKASYEALLVEQRSSQETAEQQYDTYVLDGELADVEYQSEIAELQKNLEDAQEELEDISDQINENLESINDYQYRLKKAKESLADAEAGVADLYDDRLEEAYYYITYENAREDAAELVETYEDKLESLEDENQELVYQMQTQARTVAETQRKLETGTLDAEQTKAVSTYYQSAASEWYDVQLTGINAELADAQYQYQSAENKLKQFNEAVVGNKLVAEYDGVVTSVPLETGDGVTMNTTLLTLYDQSDVTMEVTLSEEDKEAAVENEGVVITFEAYEDKTFQAEITNVSDAEYDSSSGKVYYTVTITLQGDVNGLYEGMTGEVTFITKEAREVNYVPDRAILEKDEGTFVKIRNENGKVIEKAVVTGFSDGTNTEITDGLSEGDIVLLESKVSGS